MINYTFVDIAEIAKLNWRSDDESRNKFYEKYEQVRKVLLANKSTYNDFHHGLSISCLLGIASMATSEQNNRENKTTRLKSRTKTTLKLLKKSNLNEDEKKCLIRILLDIANRQKLQFEKVDFLSSDNFEFDKKNLDPSLILLK